MPDRDERFMRLALDEARVAVEHGDVPVGAVIARGEDVVATAHNTRELHADPLGHAELSAIRLASRRLGDWRLEGCDVYVTLEPCAMCAGAIVAARIERLVFGAWDRKGGACGSLYNVPEDSRLNHRAEVRRGVLADECEATLAEFFDRLRT